MKKEIREQQEKHRSKLLESMDTELLDIIDQSEEEDLIAVLKGHNILPPNEKKISDTIEELSMHLGSLTETINSTSPVHKEPFQLISLAAQYMSKWHLLASLVLYAAAFIFITCNAQSNNPYTFIIALSPVPLIFGLIDVIRSMQTGMQELEMSFKTNLWQFILSKLMIICMSNILLNILFTVLFTGLNNGISFWKMTIYWCSPFFVVCSISILIISKVREHFAQSIFIALWIICIIMLLTETRLQQWLMNLNAAVYILVTASAALLTAFEIFYFIIQKGKRGELFETYNGKYI